MEPSGALGPAVYIWKAQDPAMRLRVFSYPLVSCHMAGFKPSRAMCGRGGGEPMLTWAQLGSFWQYPSLDAQGLGLLAPDPASVQSRQGGEFTMELTASQGWGGGVFTDERAAWDARKICVLYSLPQEPCGALLP